MVAAYVQKVADELADMALADQEASGDVGIVDVIGDILGASSQTLQETYLTSVRVRRAETRAREILDQRLANNFKEAPKPPPAPLQGVKEDDQQVPLQQVPLAVEEELLEDTEDAAEPAPGMMPRRVKR